MQHSTLLTEYTDISQRLEYLVAHSSQMVFITGEDVAVQQGFVEAFLGQQSERANVALINARRGKSVQFYQQQLAEQLQIRVARNHSLVHAFAARENKRQPVLIAITAAENVPEDVLRELWDLVLQNRFARNDEQINILMFGDHRWAEDVKSWLPTNNNDKPVLLTTQTLEYDEETEIEGDLDEMIANRRRLFQERMKSRAKSPALRQSPLKFWWVRLMLVLVFISSFSSILIWQYFDVTSSAVKEFTQFLFQSAPVSETASEPSSDAGESTTEQSEVSQQQSVASPDNSANQRVAANFSDAMQRLENSAANPDQQPGTDAEEASIAVATFQKQSPDSPTSEFIADISPEQLKQLRDTGTVTPAPATTTAQVQQSNSESDDLEQSAQPTSIDNAVMDALAALEMMMATDSTATEQAVVTDLTTQNPDEIAAPVTSPPEASDVVTPPSSSEQAPENNVADELAASQVPQETVLNIEEQQPPVEKDVAEQSDSSEPVTSEPVASEPVASDSPVIETESADSPATVNDYPVEDIVTLPQETAPATTSAESVAPDYQYHEPILIELPEEHFVLQLTGISTEALLQEFLVDNRMLNDVWVYKTQRYGGDWFVVVKNQDYSSLAAAREATAAVVAQFPGVAPFAKSVAQIRSEITVGN